MGSEHGKAAILFHGGQTAWSWNSQLCIAIPHKPNTQRCSSVAVLGKDSIHVIVIVDLLENSMASSGRRKQ